VLGFVNLYHLVGSVLCAGGFVGLFAVPVFGYLLWHKGLSTTYWFMIGSWLVMMAGWEEAGLPFFALQVDKEKAGS